MVVCYIYKGEENEFGLVSRYLYNLSFNVSLVLLSIKYAGRLFKLFTNEIERKKIELRTTRNHYRQSEIRYSLSIVKYFLCYLPRIIYKIMI